MMATGSFEAVGEASATPTLKKGVLQGPRFIHPAWLNKVRFGQHLGQVVANHAIELEGEILTIQADASAMEPWWGQVGSPVVIWLGADGHFQFCRQDDKRNNDHWLAQQAARREHEHRAALERRAQDAEAFNASLLIPVSWRPGMKDVLSGLSEGSMGDGANRRTVVHVLLQADFTAAAGGDPDSCGKRDRLQVRVAALRQDEGNQSAPVQVVQRRGSAKHQPGPKEVSVQVSRQAPVKEQAGQADRTKDTEVQPDKCQVGGRIAFDLSHEHPDDWVDEQPAAHALSGICDASLLGDQRKI